jgi:hypothetical protein
MDMRDKGLARVWLPGDALSILDDPLSVPILSVDNLEDLREG